jgi:uncharacterized protein YcgI (DUF1989 family)
MSTTRIRVPAREGRGARVPAGSRFRVIDPEGGQVGDLFAFNADDVSEYASAEHTRAHNSRLFPEVGESFVTNQRRPILRLVADESPGIHDMLCAACDPTRYAGLGVDGWHASCQENLQRAMAEQGHDSVEVPQPINLFMNIPVLPDGTIGWEPAETGAGDSVTLEAEMDVIIVLSACPQDLVGINRGELGPLEIELL